MVQQCISCPHCRSKKWMSGATVADVSNTSGHFMFVCENCDKPVVLYAVGDNRRREFRKMGEVAYADETFEECGWQVVDSWPKPQYRKVETPEGVPDDIGKLFGHSQDVALDGGYDLAMLGFVRVLKLAQAATSSETLKKPHSWILSLVEDGRLTKDMRDWANRVKGLRSEVEGATNKEAEELGTFVYIVLEQLFAVRSRATSFRGKAA